MTSVSPTAPGREVLANVNAARGSAGAHHFAALTDAERTTLAKLLAKLDDSPHAH